MTMSLDYTLRTSTVRQVHMETTNQIICDTTKKCYLCKVYAVKNSDMATIVINEEKKGAQEMLDLLGTLDFVTSLETASETKQVQLRRQNLIRYPQAP